MARSTKSSRKGSDAESERGRERKAARAAAASAKATASRAFVDALGFDQLAWRIADLERRVATLDKALRSSGRWRLRSGAKRVAAKRAPRDGGAPAVVEVDFEPPGPPVGD